MMKKYCFYGLLGCRCYGQNLIGRQATHFENVVYVDIDDCAL